MAEPRRAPAEETAVSGARFLIVEARYYDDVGALLLAGAETALKNADALWHTIRVPGALEIPPAIAIELEQAERRGVRYAGAIALGCVIRGETYHFEIVAGESSRALMDLAVSRKLPLGNGVLTVENEKQALTRANPAEGDKGGDAARAALALYRLKMKASS
ncbi:MAG: 6,7-dimethyl-8-ribityllumazine synthase [Hyphomicrobiales bacterium]|nr:6,7-dimethyl-8-ribityllumazine synthase [Hyphomicrobiales bacterium]